MKHSAESQEITAISESFGEHNHAQWGICGIHIIRHQMVIVYSAFTEGHWGRNTEKKWTNKKKEETQWTSVFSPKSSVLSSQISGNRNFADIVYMKLMRSQRGGQVHTCCLVTFPRLQCDAQLIGHKMTRRFHFRSSSGNDKDDDLKRIRSNWI